MTEVFEFGIGNAEFGKKKRRRKTEDGRQRYLNLELGMRNSERKKEDGRQRTEDRGI
jgi:hypothetical protein